MRPVFHSCSLDRGRISGLLTMQTADHRRDLVQPRELCGHLSVGTDCGLGDLNLEIAPWLLRPAGALVWLTMDVTPGPLALDLPASSHHVISKSWSISLQQPRAPELCVLPMSLGEGGFVTLRSAKSSQTPTSYSYSPPFFPWHRVPLAFLSHFVTVFSRPTNLLDRPAPLHEVRALSGEPWIHP